MNNQIDVQGACLTAGGQAKLAKRLGVTPAAVQQWRNGSRSVPLRFCRAIADLSGNGAACLGRLRPNDWYLIWPELATQKEVTHG